jgi:hypothetical protein
MGDCQEKQGDRKEMGGEGVPHEVPMPGKSPHGGRKLVSQELRESGKQLAGSLRLAELTLNRPK